MWYEFLISILQETNSLWLSISLLSMLFLFYLLKVKFQKNASIKSYGILFYSFVFYCIGCISYVLLQAQNQFFYIENDLFSSFWWFFPITLLCAGAGAIIGWIVFVAANKLAKEYVFQLMNYSLIIIAPYLFFTLLVKPFYQTLEAYKVADIKPKLFQTASTDRVEELSVLPDSTPVLLPAIPTQLFDSLLVQPKGNQILFINNRNGFNFSIPCSTYPVHQMYIATNAPYKQLVLLALAPAIQAQASFLLIDSLGMLVYEKKIDQSVNRLSLSNNGKYAVLHQSTEDDSLIFKQAFAIKP
jgi:hypothetical protein